MPPSAHGAGGSGGEARAVLVTGGAGFIGSHLTDVLLARGDHVTVIDNLSTGKLANLPRAHPRLRFIEAGVGDALGAFGPGECFDEIYHLAAAVGVRLVVDDPVRCIETNVDETARLLRFATTHGSSTGTGQAPARTLIASSSEVYGKSDKSPFHEDDDVIYGPTTRSRWSYACSKAIDEYLALAYHAQNGLPVVIARFFNTVGPRQVGTYGMVLPNFVGAALAGRTLSVHGDGRQSRCFCDVRDVASVLPRLLGSPACPGRVFNVGSDRPVSVGELAELVIRTVGSTSNISLVAYDRAYSAGFEDLRQREPDLTRIRSTIGFEPTIGLEQTIRDLAADLAGAVPVPIGGAR